MSNGWVEWRIAIWDSMWYPRGNWLRHMLILLPIDLGLYGSNEGGVD